VSARGWVAWELDERPMPRVAQVALPHAAKKLKHRREEAESAARRKRRRLYQERMDRQRAERARLRRGGGSKGEAWW